MARTNNPHSATNQFFINVRHNTNLDPRPGSAGYAVFGRVVKGMDVVNKIKVVDTTTKAGRKNVPVKPVTILKVTRRKAEGK